jgi:pimeloyl-ACP methyl ester carboxylesterase
VPSATRHRRPVVRWTTALVGALLVAGCTQVVPGAAEYAPPGAEGRVLREPCPHSSFECITLGVPADHFTPKSPTWDVTFALHRGTVDSRGVFVIATGGPGASGIAEADDRLASMSAAITDHYDVVFFDQRGIGRSEPFRCDRTLSSAGDDVDSSSTPDQRDHFALSAEHRALDCFEEAGVDPADAGDYATRQAVEDLESFRDWLDADQLVLYGESYGTQFQQVYAAAHPDRVAALVLDGVVDLATDDLTFGVEIAQAYSSVLAATLTACDTTPVCAEDAPGSALQQYDALAAQLARAPESYDFPHADGTREERDLTLDDLQSAAAWSVSETSSRQQLQQALNAAVEGNDVPLGRLVAASSSADPDTGVAAEDPTFSDALYRAVQCADYDVVPPGSTGRAQLDVWLDRARATGIDLTRLGEVFYQDLPCLFWPETGATPMPPAAVTDPPYPLLLLTADTDPNTPTQQAERVFTRTAGDAALVIQQGGPHVVYGRGVRCVDQAVERLVTTGQVTAGTSICPGSVVESYRQNAPRTAAGYDDARHTVDLVLGATLGNAALTAWNGAGQLAIGCDSGGTVRYELDGDALKITLEGCAWTPDAPVDGALGVAQLGTGNARGTLELPFADLTFDDNTEALTGTFRGAPVD